MTASLLFDTCAVLWATIPKALIKPARVLIEEALEAGADVYVSPITAWEIGRLVSDGRLPLSLEPQPWFEALLEQGVLLAPLSPAILMAASSLPGCALRDPVDRILAATARSLDLRLLTRDRGLLDYAAAGWMLAADC